MRIVSSFRVQDSGDIGLATGITSSFSFGNPSSGDIAYEFEAESIQRQVTASGNPDSAYSGILVGFSDDDGSGAKSFASLLRAEEMGAVFQRDTDFERIIIWPQATGGGDLGVESTATDISDFDEHDWPDMHAWFLPIDSTALAGAAHFAFVAGPRSFPARIMSRSNQSDVRWIRHRKDASPTTWDPA